MDDQHRSADESGIGRPADSGGSPWSRPSGAAREDDGHQWQPGADYPPADENPTHPYGTGYYGPGYYDSGYYGPGYSDAGSAEHATAPIRPTAFGSPAYAEPGFPGEPEDDGRGRRVGRLGVAVAGVCLLLIGLGGGYLVAASMGFGDSDSGTAPVAQPAAGASAQPRSGQPSSSAAPDGSDDGAAPAPGPEVPELPSGSIGSGGSSASGGGSGSSGANANAALGVVASIDGDRFVVRTLDGEEDHVSTDGATYFVTVRGTGGISKLAVGDLVFVGGTSRSDGTIEADMVLGGAFPEVGPR